MGGVVSDVFNYVGTTKAVELVTPSAGACLSGHFAACFAGLWGLLSYGSFSYVVPDIGAWADYAVALTAQLDPASYHGAVFKACAGVLRAVAIFFGRVDAATRVAKFERDWDKLSTNTHTTHRCALGCREVHGSLRGARAVDKSNQVR